MAARDRQSRGMDQRFEPLAYAIDFGTTNALLAAANSEAEHPPIAHDP